MLEDDGAVAVIVLVEGDAVALSVQHIGQCMLALLDRRSAQILAVQFDQIEGAEHGGMVVMPGAEQIKGREAVGIDDNRLAVDKAGLHRQAVDGFDDAGKTISEVVAVAGIEPHVVAVAARQDAEASCLISWIQSGPAGGSFAGFGRQGWMALYGKTERYMDLVTGASDHEQYCS